jgi:hypothetical protein
LRAGDPQDFLELSFSLDLQRPRAHRVVREDEEVEVASGFAIVNRLDGLFAEE